VESGIGLFLSPNSYPVLQHMTVTQQLNFLDRWQQTKAAFYSTQSFFFLIQEI